MGMQEPWRVTLFGAGAPTCGLNLVLPQFSTRSLVPASIRLYFTTCVFGGVACSHRACAPHSSRSNEMWQTC
jgi:hypothetical protein